MNEHMIGNFVWLKLLVADAEVEAKKQLTGNEVSGKKLRETLNEVKKAVTDIRALSMQIKREGLR